jgi:hypothetical protein
LLAFFFAAVALAFAFPLDGFLSDIFMIHGLLAKGVGVAAGPGASG